MKYYEMVEPTAVDDMTPTFEILSEQDIIDQYAIYCCLMHLTRLNRMPTKEEIIEEWCIVHWAGCIGGD